MIASVMSVVSWVFWIAWMLVGLVYELYAVRREKEDGALPLTRVVRDRLMRKSAFVKIGVLLFLTWLWVHFVTPLDW